MAVGFLSRSSRKLAKRHARTRRVQRIMELLLPSVTHCRFMINKSLKEVPQKHANVTSHAGLINAGEVGGCDVFAVTRQSEGNLEKKNK